LTDKTNRRFVVLHSKPNRYLLSSGFETCDVRFTNQVNYSDTEPERNPNLWSKLKED